MRTIEITFERTTRIGKIVEVDDETFDYIKLTGELPAEIYDELEEEAADSIDTEIDYAVEDESGRKIIDWNWKEIDYEHY